MEQSHAHLIAQEARGIRCEHHTDNYVSTHVFWKLMLMMGAGTREGAKEGRGDATVEPAHASRLGHDLSVCLPQSSMAKSIFACA